jgi:ubiquinone/menaquinone biosynthesis C-methylase UbiE
MRTPPDLELGLPLNTTSYTEPAPTRPRVKLNSHITIPPYLQECYWWAYLHPRAVAFFDRLWIVNAILFGNFNRLRNAALDLLGTNISGKLLQIAAVYGDISPKIAERLATNAEYHLVDVAPIQLHNVAQKLSADPRLHLQQQDSTALTYADASMEQVLLFFLLHEQPDAVKYQTCAEAMRVVKPGGRILVVDYHQPFRWHPWRYGFRPLLAWLEPFALALWKTDLRHWFNYSLNLRQESKQTFFGGLYQVVELRDVRPNP